MRAAAASSRELEDVAQRLLRTTGFRPTSTSTATPRPLRHHAGDGRQRALRFVRAAHRLDDLHPVEPVPGDPRGRPDDAAIADLAGLDLPAVLDRGATAQVPLSAIATVERADGAARDRPSRPVPGDHGLVQPRARRLARRGGRRDPAGREGHRHAGQHDHRLPGRGAGLPGGARQRADPDPGGDRHGLHRAGRALRELHPPDHDPLDPALGRASARCWR